MFDCLEQPDQGHQFPPDRLSCVYVGYQGGNRHSSDSWPSTSRTFAQHEGSAVCGSRLFACCEDANLRRDWFLRKEIAHDPEPYHRYISLRNCRAHRRSTQSQAASEGGYVKIAAAGPAPAQYYGLAFVLKASRSSSRSSDSTSWAVAWLCLTLLHKCWATVPLSPATPSALVGQALPLLWRGRGRASLEMGGTDGRGLRSAAKASSV